MYAPHPVIGNRSYTHEQIAARLGIEIKASQKRYARAKADAGANAVTWAAMRKPDVNRARREANASRVCYLKSLRLKNAAVGKDVGLTGRRVQQIMQKRNG